MTCGCVGVGKVRCPHRASSREAIRLAVRPQKQEGAMWPSATQLSPLPSGSKVASALVSPAGFETYARPFSTRRLRLRKSSRFTGMRVFIIASPAPLGSPSKYLVAWPPAAQRDVHSRSMLRA